MNNKFDTFLNSKNKTNDPPNERVVEGITLKKLIANDSFHSSVVVTQRNSSMRNSINSTILHSDSSFGNTLSQVSFRTSRLTNPNEASSSKPKNMLKISNDKYAKVEHLTTSRRQTPSKQSSLPKLNVQKQPTTIEGVLKKYIDTNFVHSLMTFVNKDWEEQEQILLREKRFEALKNVITQKTNLLNMLTEEFMTMQYSKFSEEQKKMMSSLLFKQNKKVLNQYESLFAEILKKIPEDKMVKQENQIQQLHAKLCEIFDPKFMSSNEKMKERAELFMEGYTAQKNNLLASVATKLKSNLDFVSQMERYLSQYQKEVMKLRNQLTASEIQKTNINNLLKKKVNFTPIQMDYERIRQIKQESKKEFFDDLEGNFIKYHENIHKKNNKNIDKQEKQINVIKKQLKTAKAQIEKLKEKIYDIVHSVPKKTDASTQLFLITQAPDNKISNSSSSKMSSFLSNVSTPFSFNEKVTGSLISILSIDKILHDYDIVKNKHKLQSFPEFLIQWFLVRTGSKRVAQIFTKNFMYSVKELKNRHKRFNLFSKICGFNGFRKKNVQEDLEYIFFQTHRAWHYLIKLALIYRRKMNENPTGYHLFPPLACEGIFKLPLRKVYEMVEEFLTEEGIQIPTDLTNKIDYYAINEISKFKSHDESFQKEQLQQIHILREINFDIIAGFIIEYIAREKCLLIEKLLRTITMKQKQIKDVLGYSQFETIYRKYYKERRAKIQNVYSKICVLNQHDMMDIQNAQPIIRAILEDQSGMRSLFDDNESLRALILTEKVNIQKSDKILTNPNSYENFRERYYYQFYDFFNTTAFLEETYRIIKSLVRKKLKQYVKEEARLDELTAEKQPLQLIEAQKEKTQEIQSSDEDEYSENQGEQKQVKKTEKNAKQMEAGGSEKKKQYLEGKLEEWGKIIVRIPHFVQKILTIDQIIVHNMRRKEMIDASQFAWRTLRDLLTFIAKN